METNVRYSAIAVLLLVSAACVVSCSSGTAPSGAAAEPVAKEPAAIAEAPPVAEQAPKAKPAPVVKEPAAVAKESAPIVKEPAPVAKEPAPVVKEPAPVVKEPAAIVKEPAPIVKEPAAIVKEPAPIAEEPAAPTTRPAVRRPTTQPASAPAPATSRPATVAATEPAEPPHLIISVGDGEIMSDKVDKALGPMKGRLSPARLQQQRREIYKRLIEDDLITAYLRSHEMPPEAIQAERKSMAASMIRNRLMRQYMEEMNKQRQAGEQPVQKPREELDAEAEKMVEEPGAIDTEIENYAKTQDLDADKLELSLKFKAMRTLAATPEKVKAFIDAHPVCFFDGTKFKVKHILIMELPWESEEEWKRGYSKALAISKAVRSGHVDFLTAAQVNSDDPSAEKDATIGPFELMNLVPAFSDAVAKLSSGEVSQPIKSFFGWHVVEVLERTEGTGEPQENTDNRVRAVLVNEAVRDAIAEAAKTTPIRVYDDTMDDVRASDRKSTSQPGTQPTSKPSGAATSKPGGA
jgi:parvulin-like peptidyl-prolyl isomerase